MPINNKLDKYQKIAVTTEKRNILVVAAPGSGKTTTIVNRVFHLIHKKKVKPSNIIVITFTRSAAKNMKERYLQLRDNTQTDYSCENYSKRVPFFGTFHGLFYKIVKRHCGDFKIIESWQTFNIIKAVLAKYFDEVSEDKVKEIINSVSIFKTSFLEMEQFSVNIDKDIFKECFEYYEEYKHKNNLKDFDDLQLECMKLFLERPEILEGYRNLFKYILVDEFQDSDGIQIEILRMLNKDNSLFAVGDEDQCIYGFRGSRPECMVDFQEHFTAGEKIFLSNNYRSPENIVNASLELIKNNKMRNSKEIHSVKNAESKVDILNCINESSQANEIAENILKLKGILNYRYEDNVVLYRTNIESRSIIDLFIRKNIPFKLLDKQYNFFEHFICKDILAYLKLSIDSTDKQSFFRIINKPFRYVSKTNLEKIRSNIKVDNCFEMLKNLDNIHPFQMKAIDRLKRDIQKLNKYSLRSAVDLVIMDLGYHDYIREYSKKYKIDITELEDIINEFRESCEEYNSIISFLAHVEEVKEQIESNKNNNVRNKDAVILSTIHGVKGMEFKNVFIVNCNEDYIPHANSIENNLEEERRLFYVAVTRTVDNLWISMCKSIKGKTMKSSRFISELMLKHYSDENNPFKAGQKIYHKSFGKGKVIYIDDKNIDIEFDNGIHRKFDAVITYNNSLITKC